MKRLLSLFCLLLFWSALHAKVTLPSIWGDGMVLQQQSKVIFIGRSTTGKKVYAVASWNNKKVYADRREGQLWTLTLETPVYGGPYTITFSDGDKLVLKNILIGEVCSVPVSPIWRCRSKAFEVSQSMVLSPTLYRLIPSAH